MLTNVWKNIRFYCLNHDGPIELTVREGNAGAFYSCVKYMRKDAEHPDGHEDDERSCTNRLSFTTAVNIVEKLAKMIEESLSNGEFTDFTGMQIRYKGIIVRVLEYSFDRGISGIGILNTNQVQEWRN